MKLTAPIWSTNALDAVVACRDDQGQAAAEAGAPYADIVGLHPRVTGQEIECGPCVLQHGAGAYQLADMLALYLYLGQFLGRWQLTFHPNRPVTLSPAFVVKYQEQ